jgi:UDP-N-acetylglucosamine 2-epimerase
MGDHDSVIHRVVHTGQHYDDNMSTAFFEELEIPRPDLDLGVGSGSHAAQTAAMLTQLETSFSADPPDAILVYGDTNSTLAATLAAAKIHIPVAHVEAGLRSFNRQMPEEINRLVADHCADRLYAPTPKAFKNLEEENLRARAVISGDVMLDAVVYNIKLATAKSRALEKTGLEAGNFGLVTVHRPVNTTGDALPELLKALEETARRHLPLVFPVHPRTRAVLEELSYEPPKELVLLEPLPYLDNIALIQAAAVIITDSGGVQKEAAFLHTPCLTMREETEWTETVEIGVNRLVANAGPELVEAVGEVLKSGNMFNDETLRRIQGHYGQGDAATRIVKDCIEWLS